MSKPWTWKTRLSVAGVVLVLFMIGFFFSSSGHEWMKNKIIEKYEEECAGVAPADQGDNPWAGRWMTLAWVCGMLRLEGKESIKMYQQFCGVDVPQSDTRVFQWPPQKWVGLCSENGKTGWGPTHPRATEAYYRYLDTLDVDITNQAYYAHAARYFRIFYFDMINRTGKPHPRFNPYWQRIMQKLSTRRMQWHDYPDVSANRQAPMAIKVQDDQ
jgi:hypothetical protein